MPCSKNLFYLILNRLLRLEFPSLLVVTFGIFSLANPPLGWSQVADFAIYNTPLTQAQDGVWKAEVKALERLLQYYGWTYRTLGYEEIIRGDLGEGPSQNFGTLIMPGGYSVPRLKHLFPAGSQNIEKFVKSGGGYLGFCAGAYYSSQNISWAENASDSNKNHNQHVDYAHYFNYGSPDLFPGKIIGPVGWTPWRVSWDRTLPTGLTPVEFNTNLPILKKIGIPKFSPLFYFGGPFFKFDEARAGLDRIEVWARAVNPQQLKSKIQDSSSTIPGEGMPSIVRFRKGNGNVILFSYHPVILVHPQIAGVQVHEPIDKAVLNGDPKDGSIEDTNYQSWNILYAALSLLSNREIKPLPNPTQSNR